MKNRFQNLGVHWPFRSIGCPTGLAEAHQISLLGRAQETSAATGCPIAFQEAAQFQFLPQGRVDEGKEPGEAVAPLTQEGETRRAVAAKGGLQGLQMFQHRPEELLGHFRIPLAVGVREGVLVRRRGTTQCRQRSGMQVQRVTNVIESKAVGKLGVEQANDVTPRIEGAGLIFHAGLACQSRHQMRRNEVAKLAQERKLAGDWLVSSLIIHALPCGKAQTGKPTFFTPQPSTL